MCVYVYGVLSDESQYDNYVKTTANLLYTEIQIHLLTSVKLSFV